MQTTETNRVKTAVAAGRVPAAAVELLGTPEAAVGTAKPGYAIDRDLQARLLAHCDKHGIANRTLGRALGYPDGTVVSKYRNSDGTLDRPVADIEGRIRDYLTAQERKLATLSDDLVRTSVVARTAVFLDDVQRSRTVGVLHGPAGIGKSVACRLYAADHPRAILFEVNAAQNDAKGVMQLLWGAVSHSGYRQNQSRWDYLVQALEGSERLIIVDNAQRLDATGRDLVFDFRDRTGVPIALVGNPCIVHRVAGSDQQHSRTMKETEVRLDKAGEVIPRIVDARTTHGPAIYDLAIKVATRAKGGHLRALNALITSMEIFLEDKVFEGDARRAFESAMATSIHHKG